MTLTVLLDSGPLGLLMLPLRKKANAGACTIWLATLVTAGVRVIVPEISDYEVRRELLRLKKVNSIARLDLVAIRTEYLPLTTPTWRLAAELWAQARQAGKPTAGDQSIDADVILAAQALTLGVSPFIVATTNVGHLARFVPSELWQNITP